jgi:hypothetical protein
MGEFASQWYQLGSLFIQAGFLIAVVWSVRAILKSIRASQEQMGALLRVTLSGDATGDEHSRATSASTPHLLDGWPEPAANLAPATATMCSEGPRRSTWSAMTAWLQAPMVGSGISPWRRAVRWLQAPAGS